MSKGLTSPIPGRMGSVSCALLGIVLCGRLGMGLRAASAATFEFVDQVKISGGVPGAGKVLTSDVNGVATWEPVSVGETELQEGAVTTAKLASDAVTSVKITDGAVVESKLAAGSVTTSKLGADAVTGAAILDGSVTTSKLAGASVTRSKLAADSCTDGDTLKLNASGQWFCAPGGGVPAGAVMFSNLAACPIGWTELTGARGRYLVGLPGSGTLAGTAGTALADLENRAVGLHNHGITDPKHRHWVNGTGGPQEVDWLIGTAASGNWLVDTTGITINDEGTTAGTNAPYLQLLVCQKDWATGGAVTFSGGYTIHTFTSNGTFTPSGSGNVEYLVVGGGGGGGSFIGGGGGAGGMRTGSAFAVTAQSYPITVGAGGAIDANGGDSVFSTITASGGGKGGLYMAGSGGSGGSGGGGAGTDGVTSTSSGGAGNTPAASPSQGNNGGGATSQVGGGGGGGGAGAGGANSPGSGNGAAGGNGTASSISGSAVTYAGGGGGGTRSYNSGTGGAGGAGGGGAGGGVGGTAVAGTANTGGGGGGHGFIDGQSAAAGGSGIVIIRYPTP